MKGGAEWKNLRIWLYKNVETWISESPQSKWIGKTDIQQIWQNSLYYIKNSYKSIKKSPKPKLVKQFLFNFVVTIFIFLYYSCRIMSCTFWRRWKRENVIYLLRLKKMYQLFISPQLQKHSFEIFLKFFVTSSFDFTADLCRAHSRQGHSRDLPHLTSKDKMSPF